MSFNLRDKKNLFLTYPRCPIPKGEMLIEFTKILKNNL